MENVKEIRKKIESISNTKKITKAMEMISISKIKKIEKKIKENQFYSKIIKKTYNRFLSQKILSNNIFLKEKKKIKTICIICIFTNKGLCGSLNTNLFKKILIFLKKISIKKISFKLMLYGLKSRSFFNHIKKKDLYFFKNSIKNNFKEFKLKKIFNFFSKKYLKKKFDKVYIAYNYFRNKFCFSPKIVQLLPLLKQSYNKKKKYFLGNYIHELELSKIIQYFLKLYSYNKFYKFILSNLACENCSRMISMKKASDSSKKIISELKIFYNKVRQSNITQELNEIISGTSTIISDF
ncbi:ATP synthase F1 subunit gamma [Buchnera aphidicola]|uniref:ATP synthase F1 subunit gamma n=1 Tax=Buchnera aphidicola TaxID=9 RepID=UPI0030EC8DD7